MPSDIMTGKSPKGISGSSGWTKFRSLSASPKPKARQASSPIRGSQNKRVDIFIKHMNHEINTFVSQVMQKIEKLPV
jgi:hypothetical protein